MVSLIGRVNWAVIFSVCHQVVRFSPVPGMRRADASIGQQGRCHSDDSVGGYRYRVG